MPVAVQCRLRRTTVQRPTVMRLAQRILASLREEESELSVEIVGDARMQRLNRLYRNRNVPTDVLAFPIREGPGPRSSLLGDVVISLPTAWRQARVRGHSLEHETIVLLIHGILHLCGYDHERNDQEARRMYRKQRAILKSLKPIPQFVKLNAKTSCPSAPVRSKTAP